MSIANHKHTQDDRIRDLEFELTGAKKRISEQDQELIELKLLVTQNSNNLANSKTLTDTVGKQNEKMKRKVRDLTEERQLAQQEAASQ